MQQLKQHQEELEEAKASLKEQQDAKQDLEQRLASQSRSDTTISPAVERWAIYFLNLDN